MSTGLLLTYKLQLKHLKMNMNTLTQPTMVSDTESDVHSIHLRARTMLQAKNAPTNDKNFVQIFFFDKASD